MDAEPLRAAWRDTTAALAARARAAFDALAALARTQSELLSRRPEPDSWSAAEVLEHVLLTDRFLLMLIDKLAATCRRRRERGDPWPAHGPDFTAIEAIAAREYAWSHPEHMTPGGGRDGADLASALELDRERVLTLLGELPAGEGTLHRIRMSMVPREDDRLDLYEYVLVLVLHAERHVRQARRALEAGAAARVDG